MVAARLTGRLDTGPADAMRGSVWRPSGQPDTGSAGPLAAAWGGGDPSQVAVVRMLPGLGDMLCAVPALRALRATFPRARVVLVGLADHDWFVQRFASCVDELLPFPSCPGLAEWSAGSLRSFRDALATARRRAFDLAIQMHGDGTVTNRFTAGLGARRWLGLAADESPAVCWRDGDGRGHVVHYPDEVHETARCTAVLRPLGVDDPPADADFPLHEGDIAAIPGAVTAAPGHFAVVHPGASRPDRRWSASRFASVVGHLGERFGQVLVTGTVSEAPVAARVCRLSDDAALDLSGATTVGSLAALLSRAGVVVTNDTGVGHLAAAVGAPLVTIFGTSDRGRWMHSGPGRLALGGVPAGAWPEVDEVCAAVDTVVAARRTPA